MLFKYENKLLPIGLLLMLYNHTVRTAVINPLNNLAKSQQKADIVPQTAANHRDEVHIPILSSTAENPDVPYFQGFPNYPQVQLNQYNEEPDPIDQTPHQLLRSGDEFKGDRTLPNEDPSYSYYGHHFNQPNNDNSGDGGDGEDTLDSPGRGYNRKTTEKPKKMYKAIERVYYYPEEDSEHEPTKNKEAMTHMKEFIPDSYEPYYNDDPNDRTEQQDFEPRKDYQQMEGNPPRNEEQDPPEHDHDNDQNQDQDPDQVKQQESDEMQASIANDVKEFGKETVDEAKGFERFLDNLKDFADKDSETEYLPNSQREDQNQKTDDRNVRTNRRQQMPLNPVYRDSLAAHTDDDDMRSTLDDDRTENYKITDEYEPQRRPYDDPREETEKSGHMYHKDRQRPRKRIADEPYEVRNRQLTGLVNSEPDEGDYLSNTDVVKQLQNSEQKYNTGIEPVYSSQKDFDEVKRLEKMIENVALLNKQKEKLASESHDHNNSNDNSEGSDRAEGSETQITRVKANNDLKTDTKDMTKH